MLPAWREVEAARLRGGLDPALLAQGGRELGAELTSEVWSSLAENSASYQPAGGLARVIQNLTGNRRPIARSSRIVRTHTSGSHDDADAARKTRAGRIQHLRAFKQAGRASGLQ